MKHYILELQRKRWRGDWSNIWTFIYSLVFLTFFWYITNSQCDQLPIGVIAQLVKLCTGIAKVMCLNPVQAWILFLRVSFHLLSAGAGGSPYEKITNHCLERQPALTEWTQETGRNQASRRNPYPNLYACKLLAFWFLPDLFLPVPVTRPRVSKDDHQVKNIFNNCNNINWEPST